MEENNHHIYMRRCFDLARLGAGSVSPNPMVGAVIVYQDKIIGEGYHKSYGSAHAEVNAVQSVAAKHRSLLSKATLYVSLEPCCIFGKTPPCTDLILKHKIPKVVISALDFTPDVSGKGVEILRKAGVEVITNVLSEEGKKVSRHRNLFVTKNRPYILLKYAVTEDGFLAPNKQESQFWISNSFSKRLVHKWRSEVDAILVGTNTALLDNPQLNNRLYFGKSPIRIILDRQGRLPHDLNVFDHQIPTILISEQKRALENITQWIIPFDDQFFQNLMNQLTQQKITSLLVEGGAQLLQAFIEGNWWDEARVFISKKQLLSGIVAPKIAQIPDERYQIIDDALNIYYKRSNELSQ